MINNIIEELREEKEKLLLKVVKIDSAIENLENLEEDDTQNSIHKRTTIKPMMIDPTKLKRKYKKRIKERGRGYLKMMVYFVKQKMNEMRNPELADAINKKFGVNINADKLSKWMWTQKLKRKKILRSIKNFKYNAHTPERSGSGRIKPQKKKLFPEEVDTLIKKYWETNKDADLRQLIGDKFNMWYTLDQIKAHRRGLGCISKGPGPRSKKITFEKITKEKPEPEPKPIKKLQERDEPDDEGIDNIEDVLED